MKLIPPKQPNFCRKDKKKQLIIPKQTRSNVDQMKMQEKSNFSDFSNEKTSKNQKTFELKLQSNFDHLKISKLPGQSFAEAQLLPRNSNFNRNVPFVHKENILESIPNHDLGFQSETQQFPKKSLLSNFELPQMWHPQTHSIRRTSISQKQPNSTEKNLQSSVEKRTLLGKRNWLELPEDIQQEIHSRKWDSRDHLDATIQNSHPQSQSFRQLAHERFSREFASGMRETDFQRRWGRPEIPTMEKRNWFLDRRNDPKRRWMGQSWGGNGLRPTWSIENRVSGLQGKIEHNSLRMGNLNSRERRGGLGNEGEFNSEEFVMGKLFRRIPSKSNNKLNLSKCKLCHLNILKSLKNRKIKNKSKEKPLNFWDKNENKSNDTSLEIQKISDSEIAKSKEVPSNLKHFRGVYQLMLKLVCDDPINSEDVNLPDSKKKLVVEFMRKKKLCKKIDLENFTVKTLTMMRDNENARRTEERLKFIFKKCIRFIQARFKKKMLSKPEKTWNFDEQFSESVKFDYIFYDYYFGNIAKQIGQPIEKFFHFRNWKNRTSDHIPKSITKVYVNYLKMNPKFMKIFIEYMNNRLVKDIVLNNIKKILRLVTDWENMVKKFGKEEGLNIVYNKFKNKGLKLPWGLNEVRKAIQDTLKYIIND